MTCKHCESSKQHALAGVYQQQLAHLVQLARQPGWKAYVWHQAKELDKGPLFGGIAADLVAQMRKERSLEDC